MLSWTIFPSDENSVRRRREQAGSYASSQPQRQAATKTHRMTQAGSRRHAATQAGSLQADRQAGRENAGKILSKSWQNLGKILAEFLQLPGRTLHNPGKILATSCQNLVESEQNPGKILTDKQADRLGKSWQNSCKILGKSWQNPGKILAKSGRTRTKSW